MPKWTHVRERFKEMVAPNGIFWRLLPLRGFAGVVLPAPERYFERQNGGGGEHARTVYDLALWVCLRSLFLQTPQLFSTWKLVVETAVPPKHMTRQASSAGVKRTTSAWPVPKDNRRLLPASWYALGTEGQMRSPACFDGEAE